MPVDWTCGKCHHFVRGNRCPQCHIYYATRDPEVAFAQEPLLLPPLAPEFTPWWLMGGELAPSLDLKTGESLPLPTRYRNRKFTLKEQDTIEQIQGELVWLKRKLEEHLQRKRRGTY